MALARYGGGLNPRAVDGVLSTPMRLLVRLVCAAKRASREGQGAAAPSDEDAIIAELNAKQAELEAKKKKQGVA